MLVSLVQLGVVMVGGAIGAGCRFAVVSALSGAAQEDAEGGRFPWGVLVVNLIGCLAIGVVAGLLVDRSAEDRLRLLLMTGVLGSFTTFSAFGLDTLELVRAGEVGRAAVYVGASVVLGIALAAGGWWMVRGFWV